MGGHDHSYHGIIGVSAMDVASDGNEFCSGMPMVMYMDGFQWTLKQQSSCLNFYFPSWTLDSKQKFLVAMLAVIGMGVFTEAIGRLRHDVNVRARKITLLAATASSGTRRRHQRYLHRLWYLQTLLQGVNAFMAYVLMLATMTFSLEILGCVILGLMIGYFVFGGDLYNHAGSVCCQILEDDSVGDGATVGTMTGANVVLASDASENGDHDEAVNTSNDTGGGRMSVFSTLADSADSCCSEHNNNDESLRQLQIGLLSDQA